MGTSLFGYDDGSLQIYYSRNERISEVNVTLHVHRSYELYYFISGVGSYNVEGSE